MDTRLAIALARRVDGERLNVTALAAELGISRESFYVYERRFAEEGLAGLVPRSRAPRGHPNQTPAQLEDLIAQWWHKLHDAGLDHGARSIWAWMRRHGEDPPSARTVHRVLVRRGLAKQEPKKRPRKSFRRFTAAQPNGIWQIDGLETRLGDGTKQVIIRVLDDHSRKILASVVAGEENTRDAWARLEKAIERYDPPAVFLSDNGLAFNGSRKGRLVLVEHNLRELGVSVVAASARHPQTCGKAEREHQTFQRWLGARDTERRVGAFAHRKDEIAARAWGEGESIWLGSERPDRTLVGRFGRAKEVGRAARPVGSSVRGTRLDGSSDDAGTLAS